MTNRTRDATEQDLNLNETEHALSALWTEIFPKMGLAKPTDNFFELGGSSIDMLMLLFRIQEEFLIELADNAIFQAPALREMAILIEAAREIPRSK